MQDAEKNNIIHLCSQEDHYELLRFILEHTPIYLLNEKNIYGKTPKELSKNQSITKLIHDHEASYTTNILSNKIKCERIQIHDSTKSSISKIKKNKANNRNNININISTNIENINNIINQVQTLPSKNNSNKNFNNNKKNNLTNSHSTKPKLNFYGSSKNLINPKTKDLIRNELHTHHSQNQNSLNYQYNQYNIKTTNNLSSNLNKISTAVNNSNNKKDRESLKTSTPNNLSSTSKFFTFEGCLKSKDSSSISKNKVKNSQLTVREAKESKQLTIPITHINLNSEFGNNFFSRKKDSIEYDSLTTKKFKIGGANKSLTKTGFKENYNNDQNTSDSKKTIKSITSIPAFFGSLHKGKISKGGINNYSHKEITLYSTKAKNNSKKEKEEFNLSSNGSRILNEPLNTKNHISISSQSAIKQIMSHKIFETPNKSSSKQILHISKEPSIANNTKSQSKSKNMSDSKRSIDLSHSVNKTKVSKTPNNKKNSERKIKDGKISLIDLNKLHKSIKEEMNSLSNNEKRKLTSSRPFNINRNINCSQSNTSDRIILVKGNNNDIKEIDLNISNKQIVSDYEPTDDENDNKEKNNIEENKYNLETKEEEVNETIVESSKVMKHNEVSSIIEEKVLPSNFLCHALLGKGSFGEVYLVEKKSNGVLYAMKVLSKDKIMGQNIVKYAMTERNVLSFTNHSFIVKLKYAFQTIDRLFLILDYCPNGDLSEHIAFEKRFTEERAKFYLCQTILALEDLHKRNIIFRDLKPDNIVLDEHGNAMLTDFGLSKEGVLGNSSAKSFCGSVAYLAPEMLKQTGHGKSVDWYLLGVIFYEMLAGMPPYFTDNKDQLFKNIEKAELLIPNNISNGAADLLKCVSLLNYVINIAIK